MIPNVKKRKVLRIYRTRNPRLEYRAEVEGFKLIVRQPDHGDMIAIRKAAKLVSSESIRKYMTRYIAESRTRIPTMAHRLDWIPGETGLLLMIMRAEGECVGWSRHRYFRAGDEFYRKWDYQRFNLPHGDLCCCGGVLIRDDLHGLGLGTLYSYVSEKIAVDNKAMWLLGTTLKKHGFAGIRLKQDGWEQVFRFRGQKPIQVGIRKRLS